MDVNPVARLVVLCGLWPFMSIVYVVYKLH